MSPRTTLHELIIEVERHVEKTAKEEGKKHMQNERSIFFTILIIFVFFPPSMHSCLSSSCSQQLRQFQSPVLLARTRK